MAQMSQRYINQEKVATAGGKIKEGTRKKRIGSVITTAFFSFAIIMSVGVVAFTFMFFLSEVDGGSMMNTLNASQVWSGSTSHDNVLVNRYATAKRGDIIVVRHYWDKSLHWNEYYEAEKTGSADKNGPYSFFIKRLIAIEGDTITFREKGIRTNEYEIELNHQLLVESYMADNTYWGAMENYKAGNFYDGFNELHKTSNEPRVFEIKVDPGYIFFMGDNRNSRSSDGINWSANSYDCREMGPQLASTMEGVVSEIIWSHESIVDFVIRKIGYYVTLKWLF